MTRDRCVDSQRVVRISDALAVRIVTGSVADFARDDKQRAPTVTTALPTQHACAQPGGG